jgi:DNA polymerase III subunit delta
MPEIKHKQLNQHLAEFRGSGFPRVWLMYGEEFLYEQAARSVVEAVLPDASRHRLQHEIHHADEGGLAELIEHLTTYSFFSESNVLEFRHPSLFTARFEPGKLIQRIQKAHENSEAALARRRYLELLGRLRIDPEEITASTINEKLAIDVTACGDVSWLLAINEDCVKNRLTAPEFSTDMEILVRVVEKGFPGNKHLLIITDAADKRTGLYRVIRKTGVIVDCTIPKGTRKADRDEQRHIFLQHAGTIAEKSGKTLDVGAFDVMIEMIGFDLRLFTADLEKLIHYVQERQQITAADVRAVLNPTREDPVYELTGAIADRNLSKALSVMSSLLASGIHELQIIMAITNLIRRLLLIRSFLENCPLTLRLQKISYDQFQRDILPAALQYDMSVAARLSTTPGPGRDVPEEGSMSEEFTDAGKTPLEAPGALLPEDVVIFKKKEHPYAAYSLFLKALRFTTPELTAAFYALNRADVALKTGRRSSRAILENLVIGICAP